MLVFEFDNKDFEILDDVLNEIEEGRVYPEYEDQKSLKKLQDMCRKIKDCKMYVDKVELVVISSIIKSNIRSNY